jgi:hypothetical protein
MRESGYRRTEHLDSAALRDNSLSCHVSVTAVERQTAHLLATGMTSHPLGYQEHLTSPFGQHVNSNIRLFVPY